MSASSFFTGFSFSHKSSDSRPSSTVLAGTKGGMFNLKKIHDFRLVLLYNKKALLLCESESLRLPTGSKKPKSERKSFISYLRETDLETHESWTCVLVTTMQNSILHIRAGKGKCGFVFFLNCVGRLLIKVYPQQAASPVCMPVFFHFLFLVTTSYLQQGTADAN